MRRVSQVAIVVKIAPANAGDLRIPDSIQGRENPLEEDMATHSSILSWRIPWTEEPGAISPWVCKESDMTEVTWHARKYMHKFPILCCQMG